MAKYTNIDLSKYSGGYKPTDREKKAEQQKIQAENAVKNYGDFVYSNQGAYKSLLDSILNREKFSYDMNADALYQQYKNQYTALGKLAMQDTIGQASALTGGYGNSYATSAGSQAYQNYLNQLNERVPELMQLALSTYNAEGDRLYNNMSLMQSDRNTEYGEWADKYNRLLGDRTYYGDNYNTVRSQDYAAWVDNRSYDQNQYWQEHNAGYQKERDAVADSQFNRQMSLQEAELAYQKSKASSSGGSNSSGSSTKVKSSYEQTTGNKRFEGNGKLFSSSEYEGFKRTVAMHRGNEGRAQIIEDAVLEGKITDKQANELLAKYGISEEDFKKYRGIE